MLVKTVAVALTYPSSKQVSRLAVSRTRHLGKNKNKKKQSHMWPILCRKYR